MNKQQKNVHLSSRLGNQIQETSCKHIQWKKKETFQSLILIVNNINNALKEAYRVLKGGGRIMCLEFSKVQDENLAKLYSLYSKIIPVVGKIIVGDEKPYEYLTETIKNFPSQELFKSIIADGTFNNVEYRNIFNGVVAIHSAWKS